jgi:hypothetical protein
MVLARPWVVDSRRCSFVLASGSGDPLRFLVGVEVSLLHFQAFSVGFVQFFFRPLAAVLAAADGLLVGVAVEFLFLLLCTRENSPSAVDGCTSCRLCRQRWICVPAVGLVAGGDRFCSPLPGVLCGRSMCVQCSSFCSPVWGGQ